ncbi:hypothetical protein NKH77_17325 [Streptomyces sp. M19]
MKRWHLRRRGLAVAAAALLAVTVGPALDAHAEDGKATTKAYTAPVTVSGPVSGEGQDSVGR